MPASGAAGPRNSMPSLVDSRLHCQDSQQEAGSIEIGCPRCLNTQQCYASL